jgi:hypothetical protein
MTPASSTADLALLREEGDDEAGREGEREGARRGIQIPRPSPSFLALSAATAMATPPLRLSGGVMLGKEEGRREGGREGGRNGRKCGFRHSVKPLRAAHI